MNLLSAASRKLDELRGVPECELKIREATNPNEPWGPSGTQMADIAEMSESFEDRQIIIRVLQSRFVPKEYAEWRQSYKSLLLVEYLIKNGSKHILLQLVTLKKEIKALTHFQFVESGKDHGLSVRERANKVFQLLSDPEGMEFEREKAQAARGKYTGIENGVSKVSVYGSSRPAQSALPSRSDVRSSSEPQPARIGHSSYDGIPSTPPLPSSAAKSTPPSHAHHTHASHNAARVANRPPTRPVEQTSSHSVKPPVPVVLSVPQPSGTSQSAPVAPTQSAGLDSFFKEEIDIFSHIADAQKPGPPHDDIFGNFQAASSPTFPVGANTVPQPAEQFPEGLFSSPPSVIPVVAPVAAVVAPVAAPVAAVVAPPPAMPITDPLDLFGSPVSAPPVAAAPPSTVEFEFGEFKSTPAQNPTNPKVDLLSEMFAKQMEGLVAKPNAVAAPQRNVGPSLNQLRTNQQNFLQF